MFYYEVVKYKFEDIVDTYLNKMRSFIKNYF